MSISDPKSPVTELSIADIHARFAQGLLTCTELTQRLLQRIERYDKQGRAVGRLPPLPPVLASSGQGVIPANRFARRRLPPIWLASVQRVAS
jgi:hypothetical protein